MATQAALLQDGLGGFEKETPFGFMPNSSDHHIQLSLVVLLDAWLVN